MNKILSDFNYWLIYLDPNQVQLVASLIGVFVTLIVAVVGGYFALRQLSIQFKHKVMYEGWKDLQQKLFDFQEALSNYDSCILQLNYFIDSQNNPLINKGNKSGYRFNKWKEFADLYILLQKSYVAFLRSFENHEFIFISISKMKHAFQEEYRKRAGEEMYLSFGDTIFPEMSGKIMKTDDEKAKKLINEYWAKLTEISAFLDDFRIELQNETVGKILNNRVSKRVPKGEYMILTKKGFILKNKFKKFFSLP